MNAQFQFIEVILKVWNAKFSCRCGWVIEKYKRAQQIPVCFGYNAFTRTNPRLVWGQSYSAADLHWCHCKLHFSHLVFMNFVLWTKIQDFYLSVLWFKIRNIYLVFHSWLTQLPKPLRYPKQNIFYCIWSSVLSSWNKGGVCFFLLLFITSPLRPHKLFMLMRLVLDTPKVWR